MAGKESVIARGSESVLITEPKGKVNKLLCPRGKKMNDSFGFFLHTLFKSTNFDFTMNEVKFGF